ncbi:unnamed protein product [Cylicocyclus nassatus]|uniref:Uncharacterized protein n=1 Tax=Cylicocyclus nassatus TaxID=53992 RepID=A0AA36GMV9_CYLNA|nr:unnamed protein product [Cylicocyclus nassatus]
MGSRMSCSCQDAYCGGVDERRIRINAELFELSPDGTKWLMVDSRIMYISVYRNELDRVRITAVSQTGRTMLDTTLGKDQKVEKISDCFVFWRNHDGRTLGVNTLTPRDAMLFVTHTSPSSSSTTTMVQHNIMAQVSILASWDGTGIRLKTKQQETTMVSVNPLSMVFHLNHGLINVDLVLNMSSLLLARTTCTDVAITFLNRQHQKQLDKLVQLNANGNGGDPMAREKVLLKDFAVMSRLCALTNKPLPTIQV